jgi:predicted regulator of Ras-like GTPase activity (Roadblock/LC7/MglB family)
VLKILQKITLETSIQNLALLKYDGTILAFFSEVVEKDSLEIQAAISAMISSISSSALMVCERLKYGDPREVIIRGSEGYTIFFISEFILVGGGDDVKTLGITKRVLNHYFPKIYGIFYPDWARENEININI